uniref:Uncharacterized protein MANES_02G063000 n=1 Tax=Rhizophora mucronata TaxID=61149 RepID=A0A2P2J967_RHIMU
MRHSWRFLLFRSYSCSSSQITTQSFHHFQVHSSSVFLRRLSSSHTLLHTQLANIENPINPNSQIACSFSTEPLVEPKNEDPDHLLLTDMFTKSYETHAIDKEVDSHNVLMTKDLVLKVLKSLESRPDAARLFFQWVGSRDSVLLTSKMYNLMLRILGVNGFVEEFWDLIETMKLKGYGVSKGTRDKVMEKFQKEGLTGDMERLKGFLASGSTDNSIEKIGLRMSRIIRNQVWGDPVEEQIRGLNVAFSTYLVRVVLENLAMEPMKALILFRWVEESGLVKHDEKSYNAITLVLGREDCQDRFWKIVDEMRIKGFEMDAKVYGKILERFLKRKMLKEAVDLYDFAMCGANKPSVHCCTILLKKIVAAKDLDMVLFSRVLRIFIGNENALTDSMLDAVLKSLTSVGRFGECNKVLKEMKEGGLVVSSNMQSKIAFRLSSAGKEDEPGEFVKHMEATGNNLDYKAWASLIEGHCASGELEKASDCFQTMVAKEGVSKAGYALELLVRAHCRRNRAVDACKLLHDYVGENQLRPFYSTYKTLTRKLLVQDGFKDALSLLDLMKNDGFPPFVDPFIEYVSKYGTSDDAIAFLKAMSSKKFPSISVVLRVFDAVFKARRYRMAQDLLSKCPAFIRNNADVLNLFYSIKLSKDTSAAAVAV